MPRSIGPARCPMWRSWNSSRPASSEDGGSDGSTPISSPRPWWRGARCGPPTSLSQTWLPSCASHTCPLGNACTITPPLEAPASPMGSPSATSAGDCWNAARSHSRPENLERKGNVGPQPFEMRIAGEEQRPSMPCGEREQDGVLQARETDCLVVPEHLGEQAARVDPAASPRGRFDRDQSPHELVDTGDCRTGGTAQELAGHHGREPHRSAADSLESGVEWEPTSQHVHVNARVKE